MQEGELVREVEDQSTVIDERGIGELIREVEDQWVMDQDTCVTCDGQAKRLHLCWICGNRPFNARHQLVDHIEGDGRGGKKHMKMRKRWIEAGQPIREEWLDILDKSELSMDAMSSAGRATQAGARTDGAVESMPVDRLRVRLDNPQPHGDEHHVPSSALPAGFWASSDTWLEGCYVGSVQCQ